MSDAQIDTSNGDYTGQAITDLSNAVYLRLMTPLGSWWADPALGSRLHELEREKNVARVRRLAVQYAGQALRPLRADGRALTVTVTAGDLSRDDSGGGRVLLHVEIADATGTRHTYTHPVRVA